MAPDWYIGGHVVHPYLFSKKKNAAAKIMAQEINKRYCNAI
jgi:hypothetical protein